MHILSFNPEVILYLYMASCIMVLAFNLIYIVMDKLQKRRQSRQRLDMVDMIAGQMESVRTGDGVNQEHLQQLKKQLKSISRLKVFEQSLQKVRQETPENIFLDYTSRLRDVFLELTGVYEKRDEIENAYFCNLIEKFSIEKKDTGLDGILEYLLRMVIQKDAFLRENALKAIYQSGNREAVLFAWNRLYENDIRHNEKLLSDGLLKFSGDKQALAQLLWSHRKDYNAGMLLPILQFIRFSSGEFQQDMLDILCNDEEEKELRLEAIRYLRRYPYEPAREILQNFIWYQVYIDWEYAAMAASALSGYPGEDTVSCLKSGLNAVNWYVRHNCAQTLISDLHISQLQLFDIYNGRDRYAREILTYITQKAEISRQEMELDINYV